MLTRERLAEIDRGCDELEYPSFAEIRLLVAEVRDARDQIDPNAALAGAVATCHQILGHALAKAAAA